MNTKYKTIFLDWHNTLSSSLFWDQLKETDHPRHEWYAPMFQCLMVDHRPMVFEWMRGQVNMFDIVRLLSTHCGYPEEIIFADLQESCETMKLVSDEILPLVATLRGQGVRCVIATDNMDTFTEFTVPALRLQEHFDAILNSFELKMLKQDILDLLQPNIPFFEKYLRTNGLGYDEVLLIDDSEYGEMYTRSGLDVFRVAESGDVVRRLQELSLD